MVAFFSQACADSSVGSALIEIRLARDNNYVLRHKQVYFTSLHEP